MADNQNPAAQAQGAGKSAHSKNDFDLHVLLIMKAENLPKSKATFKAWLEGPAGLKVRLEK